MDDETLQLRDLVPPDELVREPGWPWPFWALLAAVLIAIIVVVIAYIRERKNLPGGGRRIDYGAAYRRAIEEIEDSSGLQNQEAATRISGAIRLYLATVCGDPSLFETHQEFLSRHEALQGFPEGVRTQVSTVLCQLAAMKYSQPEALAANDLGSRSKEVIDQLHQHHPRAAA